MKAPPIEFIQQSYSYNYNYIFLKKSISVTLCSGEWNFNVLSELGQQLERLSQNSKQSVEHYTYVNDPIGPGVWKPFNFVLEWREKLNNDRWLFLPTPPLVFQERLFVIGM